MKLTAARVKAETKPGRYNDGAGLYLLVRDGGRKGWVFRYRLGDRQRDMGLGSWPEVTLAEARQRVVAERERLRGGADPISARKAERAATALAVEEAAERTFKVIAERYIAVHETSWRNAKHRAQWRSTISTYAYPLIGALDVAHVDRTAVLRVLEPVWHRAPETASRLRGRIETILDYAAVKGLRPAENPARWRDLRHELPQPRKVKRTKHQPALPWRQVPDFMAALRARLATSARALELTILTAARTTEVLKCRWREFDLDNAIWTIPAGRMKGDKIHRVALSGPAAALVKAMPSQTGKPDGYVFPGHRRGRPLSEMSMLMLLRRMQRGADDDDDAEPAAVEDETPPRWADAEGRAITVHGFRSTFRDWCGDASGHDRDVIESALAHVIKNKAEAAYARSDLLKRRRPLMAAWAAFVGGGEGGGQVVELAARRSA